jgi:hypothetical protein
LSWVVSFTPWMLYLGGKSPRYPFDRRLGGLQSWSERGGEEKNPYPCRQSNPGRLTYSVVTILTELLSWNIPWPQLLLSIFPNLVVLSSQMTLNDLCNCKLSSVFMNGEWDRYYPSICKEEWMRMRKHLTRSRLQWLFLNHTVAWYCSREEWDATTLLRNTQTNLHYPMK